MLITGRNEVVAKVMFLHVSVTVNRGGLRRTPPDQGEPPGPGTHPPTKENPPGPGTHPPTKENPPGPGTHHPRTRHTPPDQGEPPGKNTAAYGQWAAGTHPTGMHSCFITALYSNIFKWIVSFIGSRKKGTNWNLNLMTWVHSWIMSARPR